MAKNTAPTFDNDLTIAQFAVSTLSGLKSIRYTMVAALLTAEDDDARQSVVDNYGAGDLRRALRWFALHFERKQDQDTADVFWALRDDVDEETGEMFAVDPDAEVEDFNADEVTEPTEFAITLLTMQDGSVQGHAAGCADIKKSRKDWGWDQEPWTFNVENKRDAFLEYNSDFIAEGGEENGYVIEWKACASHVTES